MEPEAPFRGQVFTVTAITLAIKQMMEGVFRGVFVEGEVGQLREAASGHLYFNLKDRDALLAAFKSVKRIREAELPAITAIVGAAKGKLIYAHFHPDVTDETEQKD